MGSCAAPSAKRDDKFITTDYLQQCPIKSYESDRGFGFVYVGPSSKEVFFHKSAFPSNFYEHLKIGLEFIGEIRVKDDGRPQVRACVDII
ncbi:cold shock domain-containing protein [Escherichia coli]|nr:cold shock domain-containing protein [Escherichia coli]